MAKQKNVAGDNEKAEKKARVKWIFPRYTLEQSLKLAYAIKDLHGGNPWEPDELRKAIGSGVGGNAYFYLTAASRDYGLTIGTRDTDAIAPQHRAAEAITRHFSGLLLCGAALWYRLPTGYRWRWKIAHFNWVKIRADTEQALE